MNFKLFLEIFSGEVVFRSDYYNASLDRGDKRTVRTDYDSKEDEDFLKKMPKICVDHKVLEMQKIHVKNFDSIVGFGNFH